MHQNMSSKESRDCACFLTFLFSMPIRVHIMGKKSLKQLYILVVYPRHLVCMSWIFSVGTMRSTCHCSPLFSVPYGANSRDFIKWLSCPLASNLVQSLGVICQRMEDGKKFIPTSSLPEGSSEFGYVSLPKATTSVRGGNASLRAITFLYQSQ